MFNSGGRYSGCSLLYSRIVPGVLWSISDSSCTPIVFIYFPCLGFGRHFLSQSSTSDSNHKSFLLPGILIGGGMRSGLLLKSTLMVLSALRRITLSSSMPIVFSMLILFLIVSYCGKLPRIRQQQHACEERKKPLDAQLSPRLRSWGARLSEKHL